MSAFKLKSYEVLGELPNPFVFADGSKVQSQEDMIKRQKEMYKYCVELQYGTMPPAPEFVEVEPLFLESNVKCYRVASGTRENPIRFTMQIFFPSSEQKKRAAIISGDMCFEHVFDKEYISTILEKDIMYVLFNRTEIVPDIKTEERKQPIHKAYPNCTFGAIGAWAWGYSRCVDALLKMGIVDERYITFAGHSRGGKTTLLAGILDERASIVNPNETCAGGCGCYRLHMSVYAENVPADRSERLKDLMNNYGFWMGHGMRDYVDCEEELPFDCHFSKAMIAPRTLFVSEAAGDFWANPIGSWQTTMAAKEVYKYFGVEENLLWYFRDGEHNHTIGDLKLLVNIIENRRDGVALQDGFFRRPFEEKPLMFNWRCP